MHDDGGEVDIHAELIRLSSELDQLRTSLAAPPASATDRALAATLHMLFSAALLPAEFPIAAEPIPAYLTEGAAAVSVNLKVMRLLENLAEQQLKAGAHDAVLTLAHAAGDWACSHHPGIYSSVSLERTLRQLGQARSELLHSEPGPADGAPKENVLHVLTQAHQIGGHTRLAGRWMQADTDHLHSVVLTDQGSHPIPKFLLEQTGGRVRELGAPTPAGRVTELILRIEAADLVVLHIHPYDAVAVAACAGSLSPPTVFVDHGDHVFWLGSGVAHSIASLRPSGARVVTERRGIAVDRLVTLPIPLEPITRSQDRASAKAGLGLDPEAVLLLTVASAAKFAPMSNESFTSLAAELLAKYPQCQLLAIGPGPETPGWPELLDAFPKRAFAVGPKPNTQPYNEAADIYLDSFPFASLTSMFEAASFETPVVSLSRLEAGAMSADDEFIELRSAADGASWLDETGRLIENPLLRVDEGVTLAASLLRTHGLEMVNEAIQALYERARAMGEPSLGGPKDAQLTPQDAYLAGYHLAANVGRPADVLFASYGLLPDLA